MTTLTPDGKQALDDIIAQALVAKNIPGFVCGVSNLDDEIYFHGGGPNVVGDPSGGEVGPDSIMWICSQTKLITSLAALKLVEQGKITFDTPVADYLPQFRNPVIVDRIDSTDPQKTSSKPAKTVVTLKHLLNFTSGLFYPNPIERDHNMTKGCSSKEMHLAEDPTSEFFRIITGDLPGVPLKFEPGTDFVYGWSSEVTGFLVEKVSGQTLEQFFKEHFFDPLGMKTSFFLTPDLKERAVDLAYRDAKGTLHPWANQLDIIEQDHTKVRVLLGGIGLYSSMRDYLKLLRHLLQINAGREVPNAILKAETLHSIFVPALPEKGIKSLSEFITIEGTSWSTALAVSTADSPGRRRNGSVWWGGWAGTSYFMDPKTGIAVVLGVQVAPVGDVELYKVAYQLESTLYQGLKGVV